MMIEMKRGGIDGDLMGEDYYEIVSQAGSTDRTDSTDTTDTTRRTYYQIDPIGPITRASEL